jgi:hypothetical protein
MTHMHKCGRDDDTGTELLDDGHDNAATLELPEREEDWSEYTDGRGGEDRKNKTNAQRNVVVARYSFTSPLYCVTI